VSGLAQGTFQNLNFEAASIPNGTPPGSLVPVEAALPGWSVNAPSDVSNGTNFIPYDGYSLGGTVISVLDTNVGLGFVPLQGKYTAALFGGPSVAAIISQTGLVPGFSKSLQLAAFTSGAPFIVTLGGQTINMVPLSQHSSQGFPSSYTVYGGDISSFAGLTEQLSISEPALAVAPPSQLFLDSIVFSPNAVPEPSALAVGVLGAVGMFAWNRGNRGSAARRKDVKTKAEALPIS
jgi:hypothetical protein